MSKLSNLFSSITSKIHSTFAKIKSYRKIIYEKNDKVHCVIVLKNGKFLVIVQQLKGFESNYNTYIYDYENFNFPPEKIELSLNGYDLKRGLYCSFELDNEDLIFFYNNKIEIYTKNNDKYSLIKKISYTGRVSEMKVKKLENNSFIITRIFSDTIEVWGKNHSLNNYECIYQKIMPFNIHNMYFSLFMDKNLFLVKNGGTISFYKHNFNNNNILLQSYIKQYESKDILSELLGTRTFKAEIINIYNFKCEIACKIKSNITGRDIQIYSYKHFAYFLDEFNEELYEINTNNFKIKKYYIDLEYISEYTKISLIFISTEKFLSIIRGKIIEYKREKNKFLKNRRCSENNPVFLGNFIKGKNGDIIFYDDRILFFNKKDLLTD